MSQTSHVVSVTKFLFQLDMFRWIDKHKKNIELSRRARQVTYCVFLKHHLQVKYTRASEYILNGLVALQMDVLVFLKGFGV